MNKNLNKDRNLTSKEQASELVNLVIESLEEDKAEDIITIDLEGKTDFAYYAVVASGRSARHVGALAEKLADKLKAAGLDHIGIEGKTVGDWVLVDAHDVIVHIFRPEIRENYELEKMWNFKVE